MGYRGYDYIYNRVKGMGDRECMYITMQERMIKRGGVLSCALDIMISLTSWHCSNIRAFNITLLTVSGSLDDRFCLFECVGICIDQ